LVLNLIDLSNQNTGKKTFLKKNLINIGEVFTLGGYYQKAEKDSGN